MATKLKYLGANQLDPGKNLTSLPVTVVGTSIHNINLLSKNNV